MGLDKGTFGHLQVFGPVCATSGNAVAGACTVCGAHPKNQGKLTFAENFRGVRAQFKAEAIHASTVFNFGRKIATMSNEQILPELGSKPPVFGITRLHIKNFRGIIAADLVGIPVGTKWIFLTGKNGYGKSCVLQAAFIGLFGSNRDGHSILEDMDFVIDTDYNALDSKLLEKGDFSIPAQGNFPEKMFNHAVGRQSLENKSSFVPVVAYGTSRLNTQGSSSANDEKEKSAKSYSLFNVDGALLNIESELRNWYLRSNSRDLDKSQEAHNLGAKYHAVIGSLLMLMPNMASFHFNISEDRMVYTEKDEHDKPLSEQRSFAELASGNRSIIAMIGDMMIRLFRTQPKVVDPKDLSGIVIIDELDLHLHPEWQKKLPGLLSVVFPKVQFIASTHSPIPFLGAPEGSVFIKVNRTVEEGITLEKLDIDIKNLTPNLILSSPIFGFTEVFPVTHEANGNIRTEDTMLEVAQEDDIVRELKSFLGKDKEKKLERLLKS
jgi:predicted ATP-binding protein involved in virulence